MRATGPEGRKGGGGRRRYGGRRYAKTEYITIESCLFFDLERKVERKKKYQKILGEAKARRSHL